MKRIHSMTAFALSGLMGLSILSAPIAASASEEGKRNTAIGLSAAALGLLLTQKNKLPGVLAAAGAAIAFSQVRGHSQDPCYNDRNYPSSGGDRYYQNEGDRNYQQNNSGDRYYQDNRDHGNQGNDYRNQENRNQNDHNNSGQYNRDHGSQDNGYRYQENTSRNKPAYSSGSGRRTAVRDTRAAR